MKWPAGWWGMRPSWAVPVLVFTVALAARLLWALSLDHAAPLKDTDADAAWYLVNGYALVSGETVVRGVVTDVSRLPTPPVYPIVLGIAQIVFGEGAAAVLAVRIVQAVLGAGTAAVMAALAGRVAGRWAGLVTGGLIALSPAFILESAAITSETVFMAALAAGWWALFRVLVPAGRADASLRIRIIAAPTKERGAHGQSGGADASLGVAADAQSVYGQSGGAAGVGGADGALGMAFAVVAAGIAFGIAALTRAQVLLYPAALAGLLGVVLARRTGWGRIGVRRAWMLAGGFALAFALTVGTWTAYNLARWNRLVIAGEGFASFLYIGATGWEGGGRAVDQRLGLTGEQGEANPAAEAAAQSITSDPGGYLERRAREWAGAFFQPHGTEAFPGESLRALFAAWARGDRTPAGLFALTQAEAFWPKLLVYGFHYGTIGLGVVGLVRAWRARRRPGVGVSVAVFGGYSAYTAALHAVLFALPRYFFPTLLAWAVLAGLAFTARPAADEPPRTSAPPLPHRH